MALCLKAFHYLCTTNLCYGVGLIYVDFISCHFNVVNLGGDADTVGAIYGQLGGAYYGVESIPTEWKRKCGLSSLIELFADELVHLSSSISIPNIPIPETTDWSQVNVPVPHDKRRL